MIHKIQIINILRKYEIIAASLVVLFSLIGASYLLLLPNINKVKTIYQQKSQLQKKLDKLKQKDNALSDLDSKYFQDVLIRLYQIVPDQKNYIALFETLDSLEKKTKVSILRADFQLGSLSGGVGALKKTTSGSAYIFPIVMDIQGSFSSLKKFLAALGDLSDRIITVDSISMQIVAPDLIKLSLTGNTYIVAAPSAVGSLDSPLPKINNKQQELLDRIAQIKIDTSRVVTTEEKVPVGKRDLFD